MEKTILIVDDSESIRELVGRILEKSGYRVFKGADGKDGFEQLLEIEQTVSLVITDLFMPVMDGFSLIRQIRGHKEHQHTPILMLTTESHMEKKVEAKKAGVTGWMVKPFKEEKLLKVVRKIIR